MWAACGVEKRVHCNPNVARLLSMRESLPEPHCVSAVVLWRGKSALFKYLHSARGRKNFAWMSSKNLILPSKLGREQLSIVRLAVGRKCLASLVPPELSL